MVGLPRWFSGKESACQCRRHGFDPRSWKIPWRRKWQPTRAFLPGKSHGQRSLAGYSPWGCKRVRCDWVTKQPQVYESMFSPCYGMWGPRSAPERTSSVLCPLLMPCKLVLKFHALLDPLTETLQMQVLCYFEGRGGRGRDPGGVACGDLSELSRPVDNPGEQAYLFFYIRKLRPREGTGAP